MREDPSSVLRRTSYVYNENGLQECRILAYQPDTVCDYSRRYIYKYDSNGNTIHAEGYLWGKEQWVRGGLGGQVMFFNSGKSFFTESSPIIDIEYVRSPFPKLIEKQHVLIDFFVGCW